MAELTLESSQAQGLLSLCCSAGGQARFSGLHAPPAREAIRHLGGECGPGPRGTVPGQLHCLRWGNCSRLVLLVSKGSRSHGRRTGLLTPERPSVTWCPSSASSSMGLEAASASWEGSSWAPCCGSAFPSKAPLGLRIQVGQGTSQGFKFGVSVLPPLL